MKFEFSSLDIKLSNSTRFLFLTCWRAMSITAFRGIPITRIFKYMVQFDMNRIAKCQTVSLLWANKVMITFWDLFVFICIRCSRCHLMKPLRIICVYCLVCMVNIWNGVTKMLCSNIINAVEVQSRVYDNKTIVSEDKVIQRRESTTCNWKIWP